MTFFVGLEIGTYVGLASALIIYIYCGIDIWCHLESPNKYMEGWNEGFDACAKSCGKCGKDVLE